MPTEPQYWPFPVLPPEQRTDLHEKIIRFLEQAHRAGFRPCKYLEYDFQAHAEGGRYGWITYRGRERTGGPTCWEVWLDDHKGRVMSCWVDDFDTAAASVLAWLRDGDALAIVEAAKPHIIKGPKIDVPQLVVSPQ
jgi:hypothetical protein